VMRGRLAALALCVLMGVSVLGPLCNPAVASAATASAAAVRSLSPRGSIIINGKGDQRSQGTAEIPGARAKVEAELASGQLTRTQADSIPVSATYVVNASGFGKGEVGDPTVRATIYENSVVNIPLWTFTVTQSFNDNGSVVTHVGPISWSGTAVHAPFWSVANEGSSTSSPSTGVYHVQTYANVVFNYCPLSITCVETSYAQAYLNFYGNGAWNWNASYYNSF
jgi:hypothetical protein